jgi:low affinity Fe/Cu permease
MGQRRPEKPLPQMPKPRKSRKPRQAPVAATPASHNWTTDVGQAAGHPAAFIVVIVYAVLWLIFSRPTFEWNSVATLAVFMMTLFIQRANRRDNLPLHAKLDELLRVDGEARSELAQLDEQGRRPSSGIVMRKCARPAPKATTTGIPLRVMHCVA